MAASSFDALLHAMQTSLYIAIVLIISACSVAPLGLFSGHGADDLGVSNGRLKPPSATPNSVSSQANLYPDHPQRQYAQITPFALPSQDISSAMTALAHALRATPGVRLLSTRDDYIYAQAKTRWLGFVDDMEFWVNPAAGVIELRSASRLGRNDFGVNRERIERIRRVYQNAIAAAPR